MTLDTDIDLTADISSGELDGDGVIAEVPAPAGTVPATGKDSVPANTQTQTRPNKGTSLRDQLSSAFRGAEGEAQSQDGAQTASGQPRNADGTFAPTQAEIDAAAAATGQQTADTGQVVQPPAGLAPEELQQFTALPPEMQQFVARTMANVEAAQARYAGYEQVEQVIGPRREAWAVNGMSEGQAINQLFAISDFATRSPADFVQWFAQQQGIDLTALAEGSEDDADIDPAVLQLRQELATVKGELNTFTQGQQTQAHQATVNEIAAFAAELGTDNAPLRPHFAEIGTGVIPFIQAVRASNPTWNNRQVLTEAYDRACWGTPSVRAKVLASQEAARLTQARETAARARSAGSSVSSEAPSDGSTVAKDVGSGSVRDTLKAAFNAASV